MSQRDLYLLYLTTRPKGTLPKTPALFRSLALEGVPALDSVGLGSGDAGPSLGASLSSQEAMRSSPADPNIVATPGC